MDKQPVLVSLFCLAWISGLVIWVIAFLRQRRCKQQPALGSLFCLAWSSGVFLLVIAVLREGSFRLGRGGRGRIITRLADPGVFWSFVTIATLIAAAVLVQAVREWRKRNHR